MMCESVQQRFLLFSTGTARGLSRLVEEIKKGETRKRASSGRIGGTTKAAKEDIKKEKQLKRAKSERTSPSIPLLFSQRQSEIDAETRISVHVGRYCISAEEPSCFCPPDTLSVLAAYPEESAPDILDINERNHSTYCKFTPTSRYKDEKYSHITSGSDEEKLGTTHISQLEVADHCEKPGSPFQSSDGFVSQISIARMSNLPGSPTTGVKLADPHRINPVSSSVSEHYEITDPIGVYNGSLEELHEALKEADDCVSSTSASGTSIDNLAENKVHQKSLAYNSEENLPYLEIHLAQNITSEDVEAYVQSSPNEPEVVLQEIGQATSGTDIDALSEKISSRENYVANFNTHLAQNITSEDIEAYEDFQTSTFQEDYQPKDGCASGTIHFSQNITSEDIDAYEDNHFASCGKGIDETIQKIPSNKKDDEIIQSKKMSGCPQDVEQKLSRVETIHLAQNITSEDIEAYEEFQATSEDIEASEIISPKPELFSLTDVGETIEKTTEVFDKPLQSEDSSSRKPLFQKDVEDLKESTELKDLMAVKEFSVKNMCLDTVVASVNSPKYQFGAHKEMSIEKNPNKHIETSQDLNRKQCIQGYAADRQENSEQYAVSRAILTTKDISAFVHPSS